MDTKPIRWPESECTAVRVWERAGHSGASPVAANEIGAPEPEISYVSKLFGSYDFMLEPGYDTKAYAHWQAAAMAATGDEKKILHLLMSECTLQVNEDGSPLGYWCFRQGVEDLGDTPPGRDLSHPAYGTLRRIAWRYRAEREDVLRALLDIAMREVADRIKVRPGVLAADVDRVMECLKADRCGCERCRYGY